MVQVKCVVCGKEFESQKSTRKYCSKECENTMRRIKWANRIKSICPYRECGNGLSLPSLD